MARFKALRKPKTAVRPTRGMIPCLLLIIGGITLMSLFFYAMLKSAR